MSEFFQTTIEIPVWLLLLIPFVTLFVAGKAK